MKNCTDQRKQFVQINIYFSATSPCIAEKKLHNNPCLFPTVVVQADDNLEKNSKYCVLNVKKLCNQPETGSNVLSKTTLVGLKNVFNLVLIFEDNCWSSTTIPIKVASMFAGNFGANYLFRVSIKPL